MTRHIATAAGDRQLGYALYGEPFAKPLLYCHAFPGSRLELEPVIAQAVDLGWQVLVPERPGYGLSSADQGFNIASWANSLEPLLAQLGWQRFSLLGMSGGTSYALGCAACFGDRVLALGLGGVLGPLNQRELRAQLAPQLAALFEMAANDDEALKALAAQLAADVSLLLSAVTQGLIGSDERLFSDPEFARSYKASLAEAVRRGADGILADIACLVSDWSFDLSAIQAPTTLWWGTADQVSPRKLTQSVAEQLTDGRIVDVADGGHYCLFSHWPDVLRTLEQLHQPSP